jgi:transcriptional regulator GlxA family with amidase domain
MNSENVASVPSAPTPAYIASLIESAAKSLELDPVASRDHLLRAFSLIKVQAKVPGKTTTDKGRGKLAAWQTKRILAFVDANLSKELRAAALAHQANLSASHFTRAFKVSVGVAPYEYITRRRVELARRLMRTTQAPLSEVALECGWQDQSSFCRTFRRIAGESPNAWRRANTTEPSRTAIRRQLERGTAGEPTSLAP